jgi:hypothetical protein
MCPVQARPEIPKAAIANRQFGVVTVTVRVENGVVAEVLNYAGPLVFYGAVRAALAKYQCVPDDVSFVIKQSFEFRPE